MCSSTPERDWGGLSNHSYAHHVEKHGEKETTIDRKDNNKGYNKGNCRWATRKKQVENRRITLYYTVEGKRYTLSSLSKKIGMPYWKLRMRIRVYKLPLYKAISKL
jgi:hypothetical protein